MFIRFTAKFRNDEGDFQTGVFHAAGFLRQSNATYDFDKKYLLELKDWFNYQLEKPDRFSKDKRKNAIPVALSWFKNTATEHVAKMYEMKQILEKYDIEVIVIKRENPGYIVYEDDYQVTTLPHGKDKHFAK